MLDWLIIGGGPHGIHLGVRLAAGVDRAAWRVAILDPNPEPLHEWQAVTSALGMTYLRSPVVHHVGLRSLELADFAGTHRHVLTRPAFKGRYRRPSLELFNAHALHCARESGLTRGWHEGRARRLEPARSGWRVETDAGCIETRKVVLALGASGCLRRPGWTRSLGDRVDHVLDPVGAPVSRGPVLVVGGGLSAAQAAMKLADEGLEVTLLSRHLPRIHRFDAEPGWLGPKLMRGFRAESDPRTRRDLISAARHRGSLTSDAHHALRAMERRGGLRVVTGRVSAARRIGDGVHVDIAGTGPERGRSREGITVRHVLLATGYAAQASSPRWISELAEELDLPRAPCGTPVPDRALQWAPGLHLAGPLAELELGPVSRNLAGARRAGEVIAAVARLTGGRPVSVAGRGANDARRRATALVAACGARTAPDVAPGPAGVRSANPASA